MILKYGKIGKTYHISTNNFITIKNLIRGKEISKSIDSREEWIKNTDIQFEVNRAELVETISKLLKND